MGIANNISGCLGDGKKSGNFCFAVLRGVGRRSDWWGSELSGLPKYDTVSFES